MDKYRELAQAQPAAFLPDLAMSLNNLSVFYSEVGERAEALKAAREAVEMLSPFFLNLPAGHARLMASCLRTYLQACEQNEQEPETVLLAPILQVFEALKNPGGQPAQPG